MLVWREVDTRPVSEYLYIQHQWRKDHPFLYYCKNCILNFEAKVRVKKCAKCTGENIVELPKEPQLKEIAKVTSLLGTLFASQKAFTEKGPHQIHKRLRAPAVQAAMQKQVNMLRNRLSQAGKATLLKMRVAFHYYTIRMPRGELR